MLVVEMFERGYSRDQIVLATGLPPFDVVEALRADTPKLTTLLKMIALRQAGHTYNEIQRQCKITDRTIHRWMGRARQAGISFPESVDGVLDPRRIGLFAQALGETSSPTTSTDSTGTTPPPSPAY
jgi:methylphosphotriester-DNA--protein-cysteine methyltransferase